MSTFHAKLRTFAECKREAVQDMHTREFFRERYHPDYTVAREARLLRRQRARHKRLVTRFGAKWAHWMRYDCVYIPPENVRRAVRVGMEKWSPFEIASGATDERASNFPDHPTLKT